MIRNLFLAALVVGAVGAGSAQATVPSTSPVYDNSVGFGLANVYAPGSDVLSLFYNPLAVDPAGSFGLAPYHLTSSGSITLTNYTLNTLLPNPADSQVCNTLSGGQIMCNVLDNGANPWTTSFLLGTADMTVGAGRTTQLGA